MVRVAALSFLLVGIAQARDPGCSGVSSDEKSLVGAPCTRPKDCVRGAVCTSGVCVDTDAQAQDDAGDGGDGGD